VSPNKDLVIGFCWLPVAPFAKVSINNHLNDENVYPIVGHDGLIEINNI